VRYAIDAGATEAPLPEGARRLADYRAAGGYKLYADCVAGRRSAEEIIAALEHANLRGLGGAGFPAGRKWRVVRDQPAPRLMAVNIDEGEPGTFKDRFYLEREPHRFLEGMLIAAWAVGIERSTSTCATNTPACARCWREELDALRAAFPLAPDRAAARRRRLRLRRGIGHDRIHRGQARPAAPAPALRGGGRPVRPADARTQHGNAVLGARDRRARRRLVRRAGPHGRKGLRSFSVSGRVAKPGVHLAPAGITLRELIDEFCEGMLPGHELYAYLPGGASGGILPASLADVPLDFDTLQEHGCFIGSAAIIVLSQHDSARAAALNAMRFFAHESCGKCTPCRVGTQKAADADGAR
jgi:NADH:ubiquinone oxidoreductase subunit F (NADH-binding)